MKYIFNIIPLLFGLILSSCGQNNHVEKIDVLLENYIQEYKFNGTITVYEDNDLLFQKSAGFADYKTEIKLETNTPFLIGSITKTFTAVSIMILKEQKKLLYSDSLGKFFDDLPKIMNKLTINQLLTHTSGVPDYLDNYPTQNNRLTNTDVYGILKNKDYLYFQPGSDFKYSNSGYVLLALLIEKISTTSYENFIKQNILIPLKMDKTYFLDSANYLKYNRALGHDSTGVIFDLPLFVHGDGGLVSTTTDLYKWYLGLIENRVISESTFNTALQPTKLEKGHIVDYGQGFEIFKTKSGFNITGHRGGLGGTGVYFIFQSIPKNCIIVMTNNNCQKTGEMVERISMILNDFDYSAN